MTNKRKRSTTKAVRTNKYGAINGPGNKKKPSKSRPAVLLSSDEDIDEYEVALSSSTHGGGDATTATSSNVRDDAGSGHAYNTRRSDRITNNSEDDPMKEALEDREGNSYFLAHSKSNSAKGTSTHTMESLGIPTDTEARDIVAKLRSKNKKDVSVLYKHYLDQFPRWRFRLRNGFNMMFYGLGSKKWFLEQFVEYLDDGSADSAGDVIVVNGFSPNLSVREILSTIAKKIVKRPLKGKTNIEQAREISKVVNGPYPSVFGRGMDGDDKSARAGNTFGKHSSSFDNEGVVDLVNGTLSRKKRLQQTFREDKKVSNRSNRNRLSNDHRFPERRLYLIVHNIDGPSLRSSKAQEVLSFLADSRGIHLIASIDHINATFLWDQRTLQRCNFLWNDITTYESYGIESVYEEPIIGGTGSNAARGASFVLRSLTPNHRDILRLLAKYQLENPTSKGLDFHEFYTRCRNEMLYVILVNTTICQTPHTNKSFYHIFIYSCNSDQTLRHHLTEFMDHALVVTSRGVDGKEYYSISLSEEVIKSVILPK